MKRLSRAQLGIGAGLAAVVGVTTSIVIVIAASGESTAASSPGPSSVSSTSVNPITGAIPATTPAASSEPGVEPAAASLPPLKHLTPPDVAVELTRAASPSQVHRLEKLSGVTRVLVLDRGRIQVRSAGQSVTLEAAGVPVAAIRGFTPKLTATSTPLWRSVASGELTVSYSESTPLKHQLGATLPVATGRGSSTPVRIGAFATLGLPDVSALVSTSEAKVLHLQSDRELLIRAPKVSLHQLRADVDRTVGHVSKWSVTRPIAFTASASPYAVQVIPATYLSLYQRAALTCPGLPWTVLAGIGTVETGNGADVHKSTAGAEGPMQFEPSTWAEYGYDADGDGKADINDPVDAIFSAARYLCAAGASRGGQSLDQAIFAYNHAWWYVREVVGYANKYA